MILLTAISIVALMYKIYQQSKLDDPRRKASLTFLFLHYYSLRYVLPISKTGYKDRDLRTIKNANLALSVFWVTFSLTILIGFLRQFLFY